MLWLSKQSLLIAFFFVFSFNHIVLTKYHFVLGQASFYFVSLALLTSNLTFLKAIPKRSLLFFAIFLAYCLGSAAFFCVIGEGVCSRRPYAAAISLIFVFLMVQYAAYVAKTNPGFGASAEKYLIAGAWALVLLSIPDVVVIAKGGQLNHLPYGLDFLSPLGLSPYWGNRLRAFTQEPSYLGMVIATVYPICLIRLNQKVTAPNFILVLGLWICLLFSVSRIGILSCCILTVLILLGWPKRLLIMILFGLILACLYFFLPALEGHGLRAFSWTPVFKQSGLDGSNITRLAHTVATYKAWIGNFLFGNGLGQLGYVLPQFYPSWYGPGSPEFEIWAPKAAFGGTPSLSFLPKLLAEIGLIGLGILIIWAMPALKNTINSFKNNDLVKKYTLSFAGFLLASFGVEGYLFLPSWLIFALILGVSAKAVNAQPPKKQ